MRKYAVLKEPVPLNDYGDMCRRIILDQISEEEVFLYFSVSTEDDGCKFDSYFTDLDSALECAEEYGVTEKDWIFIEDPMEGCFRSYIRNIRRKENSDRFEMYQNGDWVEMA